MKHLSLPIALLAALLFCLVAPCLAQQNAPATLRTGTKLVVVDVVVRDKSQARVRSLKREDFSVLEDSRPQTIQNFEEHTGEPVAQPPVRAPLPVGTFTNRLPPPRSSAVNIILIDALNTPVSDQQFLRQQLSAYLGSVPAGTDLAVFAMNARLVMLQGFSSDPLILKHVLDGAFADKSVLLSPEQEQNSPEQTILDVLDDAGMADIIPAQVQANMLNNENRFKAAQTEERGKLALNGLNVLARYLEAIPGRKNLMWFSGSFPISTLPLVPLKDIKLTGYDSFARTTDVEREFRETMNLMARSQVAVYPIDSRGLMTSTVFSSAARNARMANPAAVLDEINGFAETQQEEHQTMDRIARETGGQAFYNTNGLQQAMRSAVEDGAAYYTLTYKPTNTDWNGDLRKISLQLAKRGYTLTYRHSYYANDASSPKTALVKAPADAAETPRGKVDDNALARSMVHGVPVATQISFQAHFQPTGETLDSATAQASLPSEPGYIRIHETFRKMDITFQISPGNLTLLRGNDGSYAGLIELKARGYDPDGRTIADVSRQMQIKVTAANYEAFLKAVTPIHLQLDLPVQGKYSVRTGVFDINSQRVGTLEVPVTLLKTLPVVPESKTIAPPTLTPRKRP